MYNKMLSSYMYTCNNFRPPLDEAPLRNIIHVGQNSSYTLNSM